MPNANPTAAAMRAAEQLRHDGADVVQMAIVIDRETGLPQLIAVLQRLSAAVSACTLIHGESATMDVELANEKAKDALKAAKGESTSAKRLSSPWTG